MKATICDRCGEIIDESLDPQDMPKFITLRRFIKAQHNYLPVDLCANCRVSLAAWLGNFDKFDADEVDDEIRRKVMEEEFRLAEEVMKQWEEEAMRE